MEMTVRYRGLFLGLVALLASGVGSAQVVVGTANTGNSLPFGFYNWVGEYQQVYSSSAFAGSINVSSLTFFDYYNNTGDTLTATPFQVYLSTTSASVGGLNENLANNIGANQTLVFSGLPPAESEIGSTGAFTFFLSSNFDYNPSAGNLLLTVITNAPGSSGSMTTYLEADSSGSLMSRGFSPFPATLATTDSVGLVTGFDVKVPEPSTQSLALACGIGLALAWIGGKRRKYTRRATPRTA
jgi:hypothetical protein